MKRSEYKAARYRVHRIKFFSLTDGEERAFGAAEGDTSLQEMLPDFPGWDPEEPEEVESSQEQAAEPEWFEWVDGWTNVRCSTTGDYQREFRDFDDTRWKPASGEWFAFAAVTAIRRLVRERDRLADSILYTSSTARDENEMLRAEVSQLKEAVAVNQQEILQRQANESRLRGEVQMAEAKAKDALVEIDRLHAKANRLEAVESRCKMWSDQWMRADSDLNEERRVRKELEYELDLFKRRNLSLVQERERHLARLGEIKQLAPVPFSREEWRYEFAGRTFASAIALEEVEHYPYFAGPAVQAADALLEALEAGAEGEVGEEDDRGSSEAPEATRSTRRCDEPYQHTTTSHFRCDLPMGHEGTHHCRINDSTSLNW